MAHDLTGRIQLSAMAGLTLLCSTPASAVAPHLTGNPTSSEAWSQCRSAGGSFLDCASNVILYDPPADGITGITLKVAFDPDLVTFNAAKSGPLGAFSSGGDAPPVNPGIGTEPLRILPASGYSPGAPLLGATLTYDIVPGVVTVNYTLPAPVTTSGDTNFFLLDFDLKKPITLDPARSTVTYLTSGMGGSYSQLAFSCTTANGLNTCGSDHPTTGITYNYAAVPEPASWAIMTLGFAALGAALRSKKGRVWPRSGKRASIV